MSPTKEEYEAERQKGEKNASEFQDRFAELSNHAMRIFGKDAAFLMIIKPKGQPSLLSLGNVSVPAQVAMLESTLRSFTGGHDVHLIDRRINYATGKVTVNDPGVQAPGKKKDGS